MEGKQNQFELNKMFYRNIIVSTCTPSSTTNILMSGRVNNGAIRSKANSLPAT